MIANQVIDLDLIPGGINPVIHVNQFDNQTDAVTFNLYKNDAVFTIPQNAGVNVDGTKPDGHGFTYSCSINPGRTSVDMNITTQMTAVEGDVLCELRIQTSNEIVGTRNFILRVERAGLADDSVISDSDLPIIEQAGEIAANLASVIQTATDAATVAQSASSVAITAAGQAETSATQAESARTNVQTIYNSIETAKTNANTAAAAANAAADNLDNLSATATTLEAGASATATYNPATQIFTFGIPRGERGNSGVTTPMSGLIGFYVDENSYLHVVSNDNDGATTAEELAAQWSINEAGQLVYHIVIEDEEEGNGGT